MKILHLPFTYYPDPVGGTEVYVSALATSLLSDLPPELQKYMEDYIEQYIPRNRVVYHWFDAYDLEEQRI